MIRHGQVFANHFCLRFSKRQKTTKMQTKTRVLNHQGVQVLNYRVSKRK